MKNLFWNHHWNPRTPKGDSRTRRAWIPTPFWESFSTVICILGRLRGSLAQVWKRMPNTSETRPSQTLKMVLLSTWQHSFHFWGTTHKCWIFNLLLTSFMVSFGVPLPPFIEISSFCWGCFFWTGFMVALWYSPDTRVGVWGVQGRVF